MLRLFPIAFAVFVYHQAESAKADLGSIQNLIQLALGLVAGVASYTIITEFTLERLPRRLSKELSVIADELTPLKVTLETLTTQVTQLSSAVSEQLRTLIDLHGMEILYEQESALVKARSLQDSAARRVDAMWTILPYDAKLKDYFAQTLPGVPFTQRIVAVRNVARADLLDHIDNTWDRLEDQTYELYLVRDCNYEALVIDHEKAALFIYSGLGWRSCFLSSPAKPFVEAVEGLIESLKRPEWRLPISRHDIKDLAKIRGWLDTYYESM